MKSLRDFYDRHFMAFDFMASLIIAIAFVLVVERTWGQEGFEAALHNNRQALYGTITQVGASLLGFIITAVSVILAIGQMPRFRLLRESGQYSNVFNIYFQTTGALALAIVLGFIALVFETDRSPKAWYTYIVVWIAVLATFRVYRCVWILRALTNVAGMQRYDRR